MHLKSNDIQKTKTRAVFSSYRILNINHGGQWLVYYIGNSILEDVCMTQT